MTRSTSSEPSSTGPTQSSKRMSIRVFGRNRRKANSEGVVSTVSPIDRNRTTSTRRTSDQSQRAGASGRGSSPSDVFATARWRTLGDDSIISRRLFLFDLCFVNQHYRNVVANRIDASALDAL